jgi:hypothetical protein
MAAVDSQHTEVIRWLRTNGCPWDVEHICYFAVRTSTAHSESVRMLQCLQELGGRSTAAADLARALNHAGAAGNVLAGKWLRQQGARWPPALRSIETLLLVLDRVKRWRGREVKAVLLTLLLCRQLVRCSTMMILCRLLEALSSSSADSWSGSGDSCGTLLLLDEYTA